MITNLSQLTPNEFPDLKEELANHKTLRDVLSWAGALPKEDGASQIVAEVITQDEFTHDIIVPYKNVFLVYDTT